jgi:hypothetical protein
MELRETERLLDELAAGRIPLQAANDPVLGALAALAAAVDDAPMPEVTAPAAAPVGHRGPSRSRHLAAVLAIGITLSSSGIAAAVTGDPLLPIKTVVKNVYEIGHHDTSKSDWILGGRDGVDRTLRETFGAKDLTSRSQTRPTDGLHNAHGRTSMEIGLRDDARRDNSNGPSTTNPAAAPGAPGDPGDETDETPPTVPATTEPPGQTTAPGQTVDTDAPDGDTNGNPDGTGKPDKPHHANNADDNPGKPETNPGVAAGGTDDPDGCTTDGSADGTTDQQAKPDCPKPRPTQPTPAAPEPQKPTVAMTAQSSVAAPAAGRDG